MANCPQTGWPIEDELDGQSAWLGERPALTDGKRGQHCIRRMKIGGSVQL